MTSNIIKEKYLSTYFLFAFKNIKNDETIESFLSFLSSLINSSDLEQDLKNYSDFIEKLDSKDLSSLVKNVILKNKIIVFDTDKINKEFEIIKQVFSIGSAEIKEALEKKYPENKNLFLNLPDFENSKISICYDELVNNENLPSSFDDCSTFIFESKNDDFKLKPVAYFDEIKFSDLKGYDYQKKILFDNTKAHLEGKKVNNILLYGDAGCGKSSSVKALLNEFKEIKIVQVYKNSVLYLDKLFEILSKLDSKFIIFLDDISFEETDDAFSSLKAILEGSLVTCPKNAVIYATSNRRHMVKENFQSRIGDEIHLNDTINELSSLSERFGINLLFQKPTNDEFINIITLILKDKGVEVDSEIIRKAQRHALVKGSKSPRIAKQFCENLLAGVSV